MEGIGEGEVQSRASFLTFLIPFQEGANINKSLTTLGKVISALADMVRPGGGKITDSGRGHSEGTQRTLGGDTALATLISFLLPSPSNQRSGSRILYLTGILCSPGCSRRIWVRGSSSLSLFVDPATISLTPFELSDKSPCYL